MKLSFREVKEIVEQNFGVKIDNRNRSHRFIAARYTYFNLTEKFCDKHTLKSVAEFIGYNHGTTLHSREEIYAFMSQYKNWKELRDECYDKCILKTNRTPEDMLKYLDGEIQKLIIQRKKIRKLIFNKEYSI